MESSRKINENIELPTVIVPGFDAVQEMLFAHSDLLSQHYRYLLNIKLGQVSEDNLYAYLKDVLGFAVPENNKFKTDYLPELLTSLKTQSIIFKTLCHIIKNCTNQEAAISTLYLALDLELAYAKHNAQMAGTKNVFFKYKMNTIVGGPDYIKSFLKCLKKILPAPHEKMGNIISFTTSVTAQFTKSANQTDVDFKTAWRYSWNKSMLETAALVEAIGGKPLGKKVPQEARNGTEEINQWAEKRKQEQMYGKDGQLVKEQEKNSAIDSVQLMPMIANLINARMDKNSASHAIKVEDNYTLLYENVSFFYQIYPFISDLNASLLKMKEEKQYFEESKKSFNVAKADVLRMSHFIRGMVDPLQRSIQNLIKEKKWSDYKESFAGLLDELQEVEFSLSAIEAIFPAEFTEDCLGNFTEVAQAISKDGHAQIRKEIKEIERKLQLLKEEAKLKNRNKIDVVVSKIIPQINNADAEAFREKQKRKTEEYKASILRLRQAKEELKREVPIIVEAKPRATTVYKNLDVEACLLGLSDQHFLLLQDLFEFKKGIRYADVYHLIVNQLGGEIEEVGNGSSHKRIRIAKYCVEITSYSNETQALSAALSSSPAVGGFFRPHGGAHQPGDMARFNMELVVNTFIRAGITQEVLIQFQKMRSESRINSM